MPEGPARDATADEEYRTSSDLGHRPLGTELSHLNSGRTVTRRRFVPAEPPGWQSQPLAEQISTGNILSGGGAVMFGKEFQDRWYKVPGVPGLELSGDLRFRGPRVLRKLRHDCNGRPYVMARKLVGHESERRYGKAG